MELMLEYGADIDAVIYAEGPCNKATTTRDVFEVFGRRDLIVYAEKCRLERYLEALPGEETGVGDLGFGL